MPYYHTCFRKINNQLSTDTPSPERERVPRSLSPSFDLTALERDVSSSYDIPAEVPRAAHEPIFRTTEGPELTSSFEIEVGFLTSNF